MNIHAADLNLLVVLEVLMAERSVSRAARRLGLSQPATSNALARLRAMFDDPLLVRRGNAMLPTPRALELAGHVHAGLAHLQAALDGPRPFDERASTRCFTIATNDYVSFVLLAPLVRRLRERAPRVTVQVKSLDNLASLEALGRGEVDLALGAGSMLGQDYPCEPLFEDGYVSLARQGHPRVGKRLTLERFVQLEHLLVSPYGSRRGVVDIALEQRGYERRVALWVPHFLLAPAIVAQTDLVVTLAERVARRLAPRYGLRILPTPIDVPRFVTQQYWDPRHEHEPAHRWLREQVRGSVERRGWE